MLLKIIHMKHTTETNINLILNKEDFRTEQPFSLDYIAWIFENTTGIKLITEKEIIIESNLNDCFRTLIFLGYAWGMQENGR